jgi:hypothetical protein
VGEAMKMTSSYFEWLGHASPNEQLSHLTSGAWVTQAIRVAADLGVADLLAGGSKSSDELARLTGSHPRALYRMLRMLASVGIFSETAPGQFGPTPMSELLRSDAPQSLRGRARYTGSEAQWRVWGHLDHSVRTGETAFEHVHGMDAWTYRAQTPAAAATFNAAMTSISLQVAAAVADAYDFSGIDLVVDVAGGHGAMLTTILRANPGLRGILTDRPQVAAGAKEAIATAALADRCEVVSGDMFEGVPSEGDRYLLSYIIHDWDDERSIVILENCRKAMKPGGKVLILEDVIPRGDVPSIGKLVDLQMLVVPGGQERTEDEYRALCAAAGLTISRVLTTSVSRCVVECEPA